MPKLPLENTAGKSPREVWEDYFSKREPGARVVSRLILELHKKRQHKQVIAAIQAALANGQGQPWMYDVLVSSMRIDKQPQEKINRVLASRIDFTAADTANMLYTAATFVRFGGHDLALQLYRQASSIEPTRPEPYVLGLKLARQLEDHDAVKWAATGILTTVWTGNHQAMHRMAVHAAADARQQLLDAGRKKEAAEFEAAMKQARQRDLILRLDWAGAGDLDLLVEEPTDTICSRSNRHTVNGGVLAHDGFGPDPKNSYEEYVCAQGKPGKYRVRIRHIHGRIVGNRATLTVVRGYGTSNATTRKYAVRLGEDDSVIRLSLPNGRRTELAAVPEEEPLTPIRQSRLRRSFYTSPAARRAARQFGAGRRRLIGNRRVGFQPVVTVLSEGVTMSAMAVVSADRRYVRITAVPSFSTITDVFTFSFVNTGNAVGNPGLGSGGGNLGGGGLGGGGVGGGGVGGGGIFGGN